ncbi:hypothetical protein [Saccharothrix variisporea]|uniref:Excreted virulence factor EspC (Type VII ESX diderm) n=1 Tax=Saccharothrix variisporea TaxID=543527 RepID=A0A495XG04_9PSEU|nr:hypothetical protein [Saccharothrix variisporea]RKT72146.1 hypothetical protein DFJ66_5454 [Saccharothrix variisporea]
MYESRRPPASGSGRVSVDARWVELYAQRVEEAADELSKAREQLRAAPVRPHSFGELGKTLRTSEAYARAAGMLNQQLDRACEVLASASKNLHAVAKHYGGQEDEAVALIKKAQRRLEGS